MTIYQDESHTLSNPLQNQIDMQTALNEMTKRLNESQALQWADERRLTEGTCL